MTVLFENAHNNLSALEIDSRPGRSSRLAPPATRQNELNEGHRPVCHGFFAGEVMGKRGCHNRESVLIFAMNRSVGWGLFRPYRLSLPVGKVCEETYQTPRIPPTKLLH